LWPTGFSDRVFPISLLKSVTLAFECLIIKIWYGVGPSLLLAVKRFWRSGVPYIVDEKRHTRLRAPGRRNTVWGWTFAFVGYKKILVIGHSLYRC
jgi:hypothetical protein